MLQEHLDYLSDPVRLEQFRKAIRAVVKPGDHVADLGCGSGVLGLLCVQAGAGHVCAIDDSAMIDVARDTLARAGLSGQASFIRGRSEQIELPARVDVAICDHVGYFGFDYGIVGFFQDARRRFLKPGGALIPARIHLQIAAVESEKCRQLAEGWQVEAVPIAFHWLRDHSVNTKHAVTLKRDEVLGLPAELGTIDLLADDRDYFSWTAELRMNRSGAVHGLGGWFDCELSEGVRMTNSPLAETPIQRSQVFLPIGEPVQVKAGDLAKATLMARPDDNLIAWIVEFPASGKRFSHSTWQGMLLSPEGLHRTNPARVPKPNREGLARRVVLGYCDGKRTASEIEQAVLRDHPGLFPSAGEISRFVAHVLGRDTG
jgi:protein arginine N-methyltransferase 1